MKIGIMGTPVTSGNRGVLALGASLVNLFSEASKGSQIFLLLVHRGGPPAKFRVASETRDFPIVNCRLSPRAKIFDHLGWVFLMAVIYRIVPIRAFRRFIADSTPWIKTVAESDIVGDVRGGDSFSDIYGMKRFVIGFVTAISIILVKGSMVQFPQTYGPYKSTIARLMAKLLLKCSSKIMARDKESFRVACELAGKSGKVVLCPDVAFSMEAVLPEGIVFDPPLVNSNQNSRTIVGINVNGLMYNGGYNRTNMFGLKMDYPKFVEGVTRSLLENQDCEIWMVPHTFAPSGSVESDPEACYRVRDLLPDDLKARVRIVAKEYDQHELKGVIGQCDFFIGSRMHSCIGALSQGVPCVGVAYSKKFLGVFESVGMSDWVVDGRHRDNEESIYLIQELFDRRAEVKDELSRNAIRAKAELNEVFSEITRNH